jgi:hypothetical protein
LLLPHTCHKSRLFPPLKLDRHYNSVYEVHIIIIFLRSCCIMSFYVQILSLLRNISTYKVSETIIISSYSCSSIRFLQHFLLTHPQSLLFTDETKFYTHIKQQVQSQLIIKQGRVFRRRPHFNCCCIADDHPLHIIASYTRIVTQMCMHPAALGKNNDRTKWQVVFNYSEALLTRDSWSFTKKHRCCDY